MNRPWFDFDRASLPFLRPLIGYGPDMFKYSYLLESVSKSPGQVVNSEKSAHNYFIHQMVEQGILGALSALGLFAAVLLAGAYQLLLSIREMGPLYKLLLIAILSVLAGRAVEMMVGVARISDLTVLWVIFGMFAALVHLDDGTQESTDGGEMPQAWSRPRPSDNKLGFGRPCRRVRVGWSQSFRYRRGS